MSDDQNQKVAFNIIEKLKSQGLFDKIRKQCLESIESDNDYQQLQSHVGSFVSEFLQGQICPPVSEKLKLREKLRNELSQTTMVCVEVQRLVARSLRSRLPATFRDQIRNVVCEVLDVNPEVYYPVSDTCTLEMHDRSTPSETSSTSLLVQQNVPPALSSHPIPTSNKDISLSAVNVCLTQAQNFPYPYVSPSLSVNAAVVGSPGTPNILPILPTALTGTFLCGDGSGTFGRAHVANPPVTPMPLPPVGSIPVRSLRPALPSLTSHPPPSSPLSAPISLRYNIPNSGLSTVTPTGPLFLPSQVSLPPSGYTPPSASEVAHPQPALPPLLPPPPPPLPPPPPPPPSATALGTGQGEICTTADDNMDIESEGSISPEPNRPAGQPDDLRKSIDRAHSRPTPSPTFGQLIWGNVNMQLDDVSDDDVEECQKKAGHHQRRPSKLTQSRRLKSPRRASVVSGQVITERHSSDRRTIQRSPLSSLSPVLSRRYSPRFEVETPTRLKDYFQAHNRNRVNSIVCEESETIDRPMQGRKLPTLTECPWPANDRSRFHNHKYQSTLTQDRRTVSEELEHWTTDDSGDGKCSARNVYHDDDGCGRGYARGDTTLSTDYPKSATSSEWARSQIRRRASQHALHSSREDICAGSELQLLEKPIDFRHGNLNWGSSSNRLSRSSPAPTSQQWAGDVREHSHRQGVEDRWSREDRAYLYENDCEPLARQTTADYSHDRKPSSSASGEPPSISPVSPSRLGRRYRSKSTRDSSPQSYLSASLTSAPSVALTGCSRGEHEAYGGTRRLPLDDRSASFEHDRGNSAVTNNLLRRREIEARLKEIETTERKLRRGSSHAGEDQLETTSGDKRQSLVSTRMHQEHYVSRPETVGSGRLGANLATTSSAGMARSRSPKRSNPVERSQSPSSDLQAHWDRRRSRHRPYLRQ